MKNKILLILSISIIFITNGNSQEMSVPANLQAALFKKIFSFDKTLAAKGNFEVAVLGNSSEDVVAAFKGAGLNVKTVNDNQIPSSSSVVYLMPGVSNIKQQTASKSILSISGVTSYVENGNVAVALGVEGGKPKIIVNLNQLKAEGHELSSDLLKIAKVIQ